MHRLRMVAASSSGFRMSIQFKIGQALPRLLQFAIFLLAVQVVPAFAKEHPVPLEKNVDSAKCLECHEDKSKGKAVHSAIATGCLSCHEVRVNKDITRIKLITATLVVLTLGVSLPGLRKRFLAQR